jgi:hypothetical protein
MVKAITLDPTSKLTGDIQTEIDRALQDKPLAIAGHIHMSTRREADIDYPEPAPGGQEYRHRGALYRITATST